jgi:phosphoribosylamine--glycine ligase
VGTGADLNEARDRAYEAVSKISLRGSHHRTDIALKAAEGRL